MVILIGYSGFPCPWKLLPNFLIWKTFLMICNGAVLTMISGAIFEIQMSTQVRKGICKLLASIMLPQSFNGYGNPVLGVDTSSSSR
jgi:hypothetical protein